jgi:hypothetical protein
MKQKNQKKCLTKFSEGVLNDRHFSSVREKCVRVGHFFGEGEVVRRDVRSPAFVMDVRAFLFEQCSVGIDVDELLVSS